MTALKYLTGFFAIFLVAVLPVGIRAGDICEESLDRIEAAALSFVEDVAAERSLSGGDYKKLLDSLSREPGLYRVNIGVGIRYVVPDGEIYHVNMEHHAIEEIIGAGGVLELNEGDTLILSIKPVSESVFSRIAPGYNGLRGSEFGKISMGRRIGRG